MIQGNTTDAERGVKRNRAGGNNGDGHNCLFVAEAHDRALAELFFNLC
jgi:inosine/xanthosine triphosphate pyrophosphatase family protein